MGNHIEIKKPFGEIPQMWGLRGITLTFDPIVKSNMWKRMLKFARFGYEKP